MPGCDLLRDFAMFPKRNRQEDRVGRDCILQRHGDNGGADRLCLLHQHLGEGAGWRRSHRCSFLQTLGRVLFLVYGSEGAPAVQGIR
jgi:hypothetical protein